MGCLSIVHDEPSLEMILWTGSFCGLVDLSATITSMHESLSRNLFPWPSKHEVHFALFTDNFPSTTLGNETNTDDTNDPEKVSRTVSLLSFL